MTLPILMNHDRSRPPIGFIDVQDGRLKFRFLTPLDSDKVFEIFGNVGLQFTVMEYDARGNCMVSAGIIFEFSSP